MVFNLSTRPLLFLQKPLQHSFQRCSLFVSAHVCKAPNLSRSRRTWTDEETNRLLDLVQMEGPRWTYLAQFFDNRTTAVLANRYKSLTDKSAVSGPWIKEELAALRDLTRGKEDFDSIDWETVRAGLPRPRNLVQIQLTWRHSINPRIRHGRWTEEEIDRLNELVQIYGIDDWNAIADGIGSRTRRQCLERWRWQQDNEVQKGRFTEDENKAILKAVKQYGENFALVKEATGSKRTARHISQHYHYMLDEKVDRSPWSSEEENRMYGLALKYNHDMAKVKQEMNSRRNAKDMWNHFYKVHRSRQSKTPKAEGSLKQPAHETQLKLQDCLE